MGRDPKPTKSKEAKPPVARKSPKADGVRGRDLEKRLAETQAQLQTRDRELAEAREQVAAARAQVTESHEQQTATSEILRIIAGSPTDLQPVLDAVAENAARVCGATDASIRRIEGDTLRLVARFGSIPLGAPAVIPLDRGYPTGRAAIERRTIHIDDRSLPDTDFHKVSPDTRTVLATPLMREGVPIGVILIRRAEVQPFTGKQIELLKTFADQAVIAIENVRLFTELQEKNTALTTAHAQVTESLEQQTATAEILNVISRAQTDAQPVFDAIVRSATVLCEGFFAGLFLFDGASVRVAAHRNLRPEAIVLLQSRFPGPPRGALGRAILERRVVHVPDCQNDVDFPASELMRALGVRTQISVPLLREGQVIGGLNVGRSEVRPFTDKQIALLQTFADQAVIAIENVRLFNETKEALDRQTATSEILRVISSSPTDVQPVFDAITQSALKLCGAASSLLTTFDGELLHLAALANVRPEQADFLRRRFPQRPDLGAPGGRTILTGAAVHIPDTHDDHYFSRLREAGQSLWARSMLSLPLLREGETIGTIHVHKEEPGSFPESQIALLQTFADQAVIAIENVRLFKELQTRNRDLTEALDRQTSTSEILGVISSSPTDVQPVFETIVQNAVRLCDAIYGAVTRLDGTTIRSVAQYNLTSEEVAQLQQTYPRSLSERGAIATAIRTGTVVRVADLEAEPDAVPADVAPQMRARGVRSLLVVPMVWQQQVIGSINVTHREVDAFTNARVELLKTFADQAVIAIENVRLFRELEAANRELAAASQHKSEFLANMSHELRTPLNAIIGFSEVLTERMFGELNEKQEEYSNDIHASGQHLLSLINDILDLSKIEAGRMELELSDFHLPTALDSALTLVRERAGRRGIALQMNVDSRLGQIQADERKVRQVVLNLLSNAIKFTPEGGRIEVAAVPKDRFVEVTVSDTGVGIASEDQEAVFEEFRQVGTADKKVEGTGLGLTLCRKFVELHGGRIWVKSEVGVGSTFTFSLPLRS